MLRWQRRSPVTVLVFASVLICQSSSIAAPESQFFDAKGVKIHYLVEGAGEPVILIPVQGSTGKCQERSTLSPRIIRS